MCATVHVDSWLVHPMRVARMFAFLVLFLPSLFIQISRGSDAFTQQEINFMPGQINK